MNIALSRETFHQKVYLILLALLVCSLPLSRFLLSISQFLLIINWMASGRYREKVMTLLRNPALLLFASLFAVYAIGLLYSREMAVGLARVKNALPLLALPVVMGTSPRLRTKHFRLLLILFSGAVLAAAAVCLVRYLMYGIPADGDFRSVSVFMLHIRFALLIIPAIFSLLYLATGQQHVLFRRDKLLFGMAACLLIAFLFFLRSFTGILIFVTLAPLFVLNRAFRSHHPGVRNLTLLIVAGFLAALVVIPVTTYRRNFHANPVPRDALATETAGGHPYLHDTRSGALENGHYIDLYVCEPELRQEWNRISTISYDSFDRKGQPIAFTLKRYLTSKGYRKDSAAVHRLEAVDISRIEDGLANYRFRERPGLSQRLYETLWEIQILARTGYVLQHSLGQRVAFYSAAKALLPDQLWSGTGTGDVYQAMLQSARAASLEVDPKWEGKPHNQFLFFLLAFGLPGLVYILFCLIYPVIATHAYRSLLFNLFAGIMALSMLTLDTLESYDSMVFFAFFYSLFVFSARQDQFLNTNDAMISSNTGLTR